jgi:hypothetical protein
LIDDRDDADAIDEQQDFDVASYEQTSQLHVLRLLHDRRDDSTFPSFPTSEPLLVSKTSFVSSLVSSLKLLLLFVLFVSVEVGSSTVTTKNVI